MTEPRALLVPFALALLASAVLAACGLPRLDRTSINPPASSPRLQLDQVQLPPGFAIELVSDAVPSARAMTFGSQGTLFVGSKDAGSVYALRYDGPLPAEPILIAEGLTQPHGVAFRDGALYVAEISRILRFDDIEARLHQPPAPVVVYDALPSYKHHGMRTLRFGPDGLLYYPIGAPCNICLPAQQYAAIHRLDVGSRPPRSEKIADGVRNTVGFDFHPGTGELWFTDNGRDFLGENVPPDELNRLAEQGQHFGYPHCHGGDVRDPEFGLRSDCADFAAPAQKLAPHAAALGMRFYTGEQFPPEYRGRIFIAERGSFNRAEPIGYRISEVILDGDRAVAYRPFAEGWMRGGRAWGRPVDVEIAPDGALLVSDDTRGAVYRIRYLGEAVVAAGD
jgi:glucose/arabinose dehydrogenase